MRKQESCPQCGVEMYPCDYSPLYKGSWVHPKNDCLLSEMLIFECQLKTLKEQATKKGK